MEKSSTFGKNIVDNIEGKQIQVGDRFTINILGKGQNFSHSYQEYLKYLDLPNLTPESIQKAYYNALPSDALLWDSELENNRQILEKLQQHRRLAKFFQQLSQDENLDLETRDEFKQIASKLAAQKPQEEDRNPPREDSGDNPAGEKKSYLIATVEPMDNDKNQYWFNGWVTMGEPKDCLEYSNYQSLLPRNATASGIKCELNQLESLLEDFFEECLNYKPNDNQLIVEIFLPLDLLYTAVEWWNIEDYDSSKRPIGTMYSVRLRSVERLEGKYLKRYRNKWRLKWEKVQFILKQQPREKYFRHLEPMEDKDFTENSLICELDEKIGLSSSSCPPERKRKDVFKAILKSATPIALLTRYNLPDRANQIEQLLKQPLCSLCDSVRKKRLEAFAQPDHAEKQKHLGSHLAFIWENPYRLTPNIIVELMETGE